jgi:hypothetical protein
VYYINILQKTFHIVNKYVKFWVSHKECVKCVMHATQRRLRARYRSMSYMYVIVIIHTLIHSELDGPALSVTRRAIAIVKQHWMGAQKFIIQSSSVLRNVR